MESASQLAQQALGLALESVGQLARWRVLFEEKLRQAEEKQLPPDLKEYVQFLTSLKRTLEIARLCGAVMPKEGVDEAQAGLDLEALAGMLSEED